MVSLENQIQQMAQLFKDKDGTIDEQQRMLAADRDMRSNNFEMLAIYHSHPTTHPVPSAKDRERSYSSNVVNVIISLKGDPPEVRAWWITEADHREAEWKLI